MNDKKRNARKFTIELNDKLYVEYGWMDKSSTDVMYLYIKCWITPVKEFEYSRQLKRVISKMHDRLGDAIQSDRTYYGKFIFDSFYNVDTVSVGNKRFLSLEAFLRRRANGNSDVDIECYEGKIRALLGDLCNEYVSALEGIGFDVRREKNG